MTNCPTDIYTFFNNASVAAFLGAVFAFLLILIWDWRKDGKLKQHIVNEVARGLAHSTAKLASTQRNLASIRHKNLVEGADLLPTDTTVLRRLLSEGWHLLTPDQQRAVDAVVHHFEGTDRILADVRRLTDELREMASTDPGRNEHQERLVSAYLDAVLNLKIAVEMAANYAAGRFLEITSKKYRSADYEEPAAGPEAK